MIKVIILMIFVCCCSCVFSPSVRYYHKDNIKFSATLNTNSLRKYDSLQIGTPEQPYYQHAPSFAFELEGKVVRSDNIDILKFKELSVVKDPSGYIGDEWPAGTKHYYYSGYGVLAYEGKIMQFYAVNLGNIPNKKTPKIALSENDIFFPFPLTEEVVIKIFGKEDKFHDFFMH